MILPWEFPLDGADHQYLPMTDVPGFSRFRCTSRSATEFSFSWQAPGRDANCITARLAPCGDKLIIECRRGDSVFHTEATRDARPNLFQKAVKGFEPRVRLDSETRRGKLRK